MSATASGFPAIDSRVQADLVARFHDDLRALWPPAGRDGPLGLAVSGGPDSLALLLLAHEAMPGEIAVASINHGLRVEAAGEVALVERICRERDIPFTALNVEIGEGNVQARAREARYEALGQFAEDQGLGAIATAHHADDQAETLLMRLNRGSGLAGLAGVRAASTLPSRETPLLRPLLTWRKADLERVCADAGIKPASDPSNQDERFDRARMRAAISTADWLDVPAIAESAEHLSEALWAIEWYADADFDEQVFREDTENGPVFKYYANVPRVIAIETICRIIAQLGGQATRSEAGRAFDRLWQFENASIAGVLITPDSERIGKLGVEMRVWRFAPEPPRRTH